MKLINRQHQRRSIQSLLTASLFVAIFHCHLPLLAEDVKELTVNELVQHWQARQERVRTLHAKYRESRTVIKGTNMGPDTADAKGPWPPEDTTNELNGEIWISPTKWRDELHGPKWHPISGTFVEMHYMNIFDGEKSGTYFGKEKPADDAVPSMYISPAAARGNKNEAWRPSRLPWLLTFRNSLPQVYGISSTTWKLSDLRTTIDGRSCYAIEKKKKSRPDRFYRCWIDPLRDYSIVRREFGFGNIVNAQDDIDFREDPQLGWVPSAWRFTSQVKGNDGLPFVLQTSEFSVESLKINEPIEEEVFAFAPPPGTLVNETVGSGENAKIERYLVQQDDHKRPVLEEELLRSATYTELLESPSGAAGRPEPETDSTWILWSLAMVTIIMTATYFIRRHA